MNRTAAILPSGSSPSRAAVPSEARSPTFASPLRLRSDAPSLRPRSSAFTLVELIVVMILIAILAGFIAPRIVDTRRREAEHESTEIARLLSVAARRSALSGEVVAVEYDGAARRLSLVALREVDSGRSRKQSWIQDPLVQPLNLTTVDILRVNTDGQTIGAAGGKWWIDFNPTEPRPTIWLLVGATNSDTASQWQVELLPEETSASRRLASLPSRASESGALRVDLDATNQGERAW